MEYLEYYDLYCQVKKAKKDYYKVLNDFGKLKGTVASGVSKIKDVVAFVNNNSGDSKLINYSYQLPILEDRLKTQKYILAEKEMQLIKQSEKLKASKNLYDKIYVLKYMQKKKYYQIAQAINYSYSQTYEHLNKIKFQLKLIEKKYEEN